MGWVRTSVRRRSNWSGATKNSRYACRGARIGLARTAAAQVHQYGMPSSGTQPAPPRAVPGPHLLVDVPVQPAPAKRLVRGRHAVDGRL